MRFGSATRNDELTNNARIMPSNQDSHQIGSIRFIHPLFANYNVQFESELCRMSLRREFPGLLFL